MPHYLIVRGRTSTQLKVVDRFPTRLDFFYFTGFSRIILMRKILAFLFLLWLMVSCYTPVVQYTSHPAFPVTEKVIPVYIDIYFSQDDKMSIQDAIDQWNYSLNGLIVLEIKSDKFDMDPDELKYIIATHGLMIFKINSDNYHVDNDAELAFVNDLSGNELFLIRDRMSSADVKGITLHELGHVLGLTHLDQGIMRPNFHAEDINCIDKFAIDQLSSHLLIPSDRFNYCVVN
jgi:hypothetical protein